MIVLKIFMYIGLGLAGLIVAYALYMLIIAVIPGIKVPKQPLPKKRRRSPEKTAPRQDVRFSVKGVQISGWLYLPEKGGAPFPCIIMAHGLGATKTMGLDAYAGRFKDAGFAVLVFDYRHLGDSGGEPRQLVWISYQQQDFAAAIDYAGGLDEIDADRIALWGTSLSGGHVVVAAARDDRIACVSSQVPLLDGEAGGTQRVKAFGWKQGLRLAFVHALRDMVRSWLGLSPHKVPLAGKTGTLALMPDEGAWRTFTALAPEDFVNEACARIFIRMDKYKALKYLDRVHCPVLLQFADQDITNPPDLIEDAGRRLGERGQVIRYPIDHFDIYLGEDFDRAVRDQIAFFSKHLMA